MDNVVRCIFGITPKLNPLIPKQKSSLSVLMVVENDKRRKNSSSTWTQQERSSSVSAGKVARNAAAPRVICEHPFNDIV